MTKLGLGLALTFLPALLVAQADSSRMHVDTTRARHERTSAGEIGRPSTRNHGLTADQTKQLQTSLRQASCDPGPVDGRWGPRTQRAMNCARQKNSISGNNPNDVFRSLNLSFTTSDRPMRDTLRKPPTTRKDTTTK